MPQSNQENNATEMFPAPPSKSALKKSAPRMHTEKCSREAVFDWLKLIANALVPLMIGIITIVITIQQQKVAQENRHKDLIIATEQRKQDLEIARLRREEDKEASRLQRKEDMEMAQDQREQDRNVSKLQRDLDSQIAKDKRSQDDELAEKQRALAWEQRQHELAVAYAQRANELSVEDDRQKENILVAYQRDLAAILLEYGTELTDKKNVARFSVQMKTRTALRQLNPARRTILVRSLYDAGILTLEFADGGASFIAFSNLSYVDFGESRDSLFQDSTFLYDRFNARGADLRYASFRNIFMSNFEPDLDKSNLDGSDWTNSHLKIVTIHNTSMVGAIFESTKLEEIQFLGVKLDQISFGKVKFIHHCTFTESSLQKTDWSPVTYRNITAEELRVDKNVYNSTFYCLIYDGSNMDYVNFTGVILRAVKFINVNMTMCTFTHSILVNVIFQNVDMTGCIGLDISSWSLVVFISVILPSGTFIQRSENADNYEFQCPI